MQPAVPGFWASVPSGDRSNTATEAFKSEATNTLAPSGLTATDRGVNRAVPSAQGPAPVSEMQPAVPAFWVSVPSAARSNTATPRGPSPVTT